MNTDTTPPSSDSKQITIDVPAERLAEFYAFFGRFLAGGAGGGRRGRHGPGGPGHRGHHCGHHHRSGRAADEAETTAPGRSASDG